MDGFPRITFANLYNRRDAVREQAIGVSPPPRGGGALAARGAPRRTFRIGEESVEPLTVEDTNVDRVGRIDGGGKRTTADPHRGRGGEFRFQLPEGGSPGPEIVPLDT